jgi:hypothetical protein
MNRTARSHLAAAAVVITTMVVVLVGCATAPDPDTTATKTARIRVESSRPGEIYVDGRLRGSATPGEQTEIDVEPGAHVVSLLPTNGEEAFERVTVEAGSVLPVRFDFGAPEESRGADGNGAAGQAGAGDTGEETDSREPSPSRLTSPSGSLARSPEQRGAPDLGTPPAAPSGSMVVRTPEGVYEGEIADGLPEGWGTMNWDNGAEYRGQWRKGRPEGSGVHTWPDGARYVGEWQEGARHGVGKMEWANGVYYEGAWKDDVPTGRGYMEWPDGSTYEGEFSNGRPHGVGTYREPDGLTYEGSFEEGRATGGVLTVPTGEQYWATMDEEGAWIRERPVESEMEDNERSDPQRPDDES